MPAGWLRATLLIVSPCLKMVLNAAAFFNKCRRLYFWGRLSTHDSQVRDELPLEGSQRTELGSWYWPSEEQTSNFHFLLHKLKRQLTNSYIWYLNRQLWEREGPFSICYATVVSHATYEDASFRDAHYGKTIVLVPSYVHLLLKFCPV